MNASAHPPAAPFLWGSFETFPVDDVFAVLALSRQLVDVRLSDAEREVGAITVKAGHVLGAEDFRTPASGAIALKALVRDPGTAFSVTMLPDDQAETKMRDAVVIGTLTELFPEAGNGHVPGAVAPVSVRRSQEAEAATDYQRKESGLAAQKPVDDGTRDAVSSGYESRSHDGVTAPAPETASARGLAVDAPSEAKVADEVTLRGTLEEIRFEELLEVLQLNPGPMHILFMRDGNAVGTLDLVSGQVGKTTAGSLHGREAFARLCADPGETFEVQARAEGVEPADVLGSFSELLVEARESGAVPPVKQGAPQSERSLFMEGWLADFSFELLIASLHLFQQPAELELRGDGDLLHRVQLKSGRIVSAESAGAGGGDRALAAIRKNPGTEFSVYRRRELDDGTAIAPLKVLISEPDPAPPTDQSVAGTADRPADIPAAPAHREAETDNARLSGIEGRLDAVAAGITELRQALQAEKQAPGEAPQVPQALSEFVSATANFVAVLEKSHKDALQQVSDTLRTRHRGMLRAVIALQILCLVAIGFLAALAAL